MAEIIDARVKQKTGVAADFAGYTLLEGEIALVRTSASGPVWNFKVGPGNFDSLDWSLNMSGAAQKADTSTVFPAGVPGLYIPTEDGTYEGVTVDLSSGYTQLIWDGTTLTDVVFPIDLTGYVAKTEIGTEPVYSENYFDTGTIVNNSLVNSSGALQASSGWKRIDIDYSGDLHGQTLIVEGVQITSIYSSFFNAAKDTTVKFNGSHPSNESAKNCFSTSPSAAWFIMSIKKPENDDSIYAGVTVRTMDGEVIVQIDGKDLKGGLSVSEQGGSDIAAERIVFDGATVTDEGGKTVKVATPPPYDQSLNKADSVEFAQVNAGNVGTDFFATQAMSLDISVWDETGTAPIPIGGIYVLPDGTMKRRMS